MGETVKIYIILLGKFYNGHREIAGKSSLDLFVLRTVTANLTAMKIKKIVANSAFQPTRLFPQLVCWLTRSPPLRIASAFQPVR